MRRVALAGFLACWACVPVGPPPDESAVSAILNGPTLAQATTHWRRPDCFIEFGNGFCSAPFHFALAADGTMRWSLEPNGLNVGNEHRWGVSTWTRLGDDALVLNDLPFVYMPSRALTGINGSVSEGVFRASFEKTNNAPFTIMTGPLPSYCGGCDAGFPNGTAACLETRDGRCQLSGCNAGFGDCDKKESNGCEKDLAGEAQRLQVAAVTCAPDGGLALSGCAADRSDCDGDPTNGCEYPGAPCPERLSATAGLRLVADGTHLYWTSPTGVHRLATAGGAQEDLVSGESPRGLALTSTHVYWGSSGQQGVGRVPRAGGQVERLYQGNVAWELAADEAHVYWSDYVNVDRIAHDAGLNQIEILGAYGTGGVALADGLLWTTTDTGAVWRVPLDGGTASRVDTTQGPAVAVTTEGPWLYWSAANGIFRVDRDGGVPAKVAPGGVITALAVDGTHVFWSSDAGVYSTPLLGGSDTRHGALRATSLAIDGTSVYWVSDLGLFRAPR